MQPVFPTSEERFSGFSVAAREIGRGPKKREVGGGEERGRKRLRTDPAILKTFVRPRTKVSDWLTRPRSFLLDVGTEREKRE